MHVKTWEGGKLTTIVIFIIETGVFPAFGMAVALVYILPKPG